MPVGGGSGFARRLYVPLCACYVLQRAEQWIGLLSTRQTGMEPTHRRPASGPVFLFFHHSLSFSHLALLLVYVASVIDLGPSHF